VSRAQLMLQSLLADRFKLVVHPEARELATYALVVARRDGTIGPQLQAVDARLFDGRGRAPARAGAGRPAGLPAFAVSRPPRRRRRGAESTREQPRGRSSDGWCSIAPV
jgi:uncharacterized protein (TIGR03435 family)